MDDRPDRLAQLERQLRHTRLLVGLTLAALLVFTGAAASQKPAENLKVKSLTAEAVSAGNITLRDNQGRPRVSILMGNDGGPKVALLDEATKVRVLLALHENQHPLIQLSDAEEAPQVNLLYNKNLGGGLTVHGTAGQAMLVVPTSAAPIIELRDGQGEKVFSAP